MFGRRSASTSAVQSRAASLSDKTNSGEDILYTVNGISAAHPGARRTNIDSDSDDDETMPTPANAGQRHASHTGLHPVWQALQEETASLTPASDNGSVGFDFPGTTSEVKTLQISHMSRQCTVSDVYRAFDRTRDTMRIDWKSETMAHLHFETSDDALQAYFGYLSSNHSIGTVEPLDVATQAEDIPPISVKANTAPQGPVLPNIKKRSSWTPPTSTSKLMTLSSLSTWRGNGLEKQHSTADLDLSSGGLFSKGHRSNSSRSSMHSKSTDRTPALGRELSSSTAVTMASERSAVTSASVSGSRLPQSPTSLGPTLDDGNTESVPRKHPISMQQPQSKKEVKSHSARRFLPSGFGFGLRHSSRSKDEHG